MGKSISKEEILQKTEGGLKIFMYYMHEMRKSGRGYVAPCPFRDDKKPSMTIYKWSKNEQWYFKDQAFPDLYSGDCFKFIQQMEDMEEAGFIEILTTAAEICEELGIQLTGEYEALEIEYGTPVEVTAVREPIVTGKTSDYLKKYGLDVQTATELGMIPVNAVNVKHDCGEYRTYNFPQTAFFFHGTNGGTCYVPKPKSFIHIFKEGGSEFLAGDFIKSSVVVFTAGAKDAVNLHHHTGLPCIALSSEGASPSEELIKRITSEGVVPVVLYDLDDAGLHHSNRLGGHFNMCVVNLSELIPDDFVSKVNDVSDYVEHGLDTGALKHLILTSAEEHKMSKTEGETLKTVTHE